jgi:predicted MFS family arabinose efflux permease
LTGFLGVGILEMRGIGGRAGWRYMFLIEGLFTLAIGIASFFLMPANPSQTKTKFRPKGYFTDNEVKIIVNRVLRDDPTKSTMHNRQALPVKTIFRCIADFDMIPMYLIGLLFGIGSYPVQQYFQLSMKQLGFTTLQSNLLSIPNAAISIVNLLIITVVSELVDNRAFVSMAENLWMLPNYIALLTLPSPISGWTYFAVSTVLLG